MPLGAAEHFAQSPLALGRWLCSGDCEHRFFSMLACLRVLGGGLFSARGPGSLWVQGRRGCKLTAVTRAGGTRPPQFVLDLETLKTMAIQMSLVIP